MKRILISCVALAAFAAPAFAAEPNGEFIFKDNRPDDYTSIDNLVGQYSAQIIQNGQFVSGNCDCSFPWDPATPADQTTSPGSRADIVHDSMVQLGMGKGKVK